MSGFSQTQIIGNLGKDPELRYAPSGDPVATFSVAVNKTWKDDKGDKHEKVQWYNVACWGKLGEICGQYLKKGKQVFLQGEMESREYTDKEGVKRAFWELKAHKMVMLGGRDDDDGSGYSRAPAGATSRPPAQSQRPAAGGTTQSPAGEAEFNEDDIPF